MELHEYPIEPSKGISHFPKGVLCLIKQVDTGKEEVKIKRISGDEFEFEITPKDLTEADQKDFPIRIYEKEESKNIGKEPIIKSEKRVDLTKENKHIVKVENGCLLVFGNTIIYMPGFGLIVVNTTEIDPCTFQMLYNESFNNGWGVVHKQGESQFLIDCSVIFASGYFIDTEKQAEFGAEAAITISQDFHLRLGEVDNVSEHIGKKGCNIILHPYPGQTIWANTQKADIELYNTEILLKSAGDGIMTMYAGNSKIFRVWGSRIRGGEYIQIQHFNYAEGKYAFAHTDIEEMYCGLMLTGSYSSTFLSDVRIIGGYSGLEFLSSHGAIIYNLEFIDNSVVAKFSGSDGSYNFINCTSGNWAFGDIGLCIVNQQYNFELKVIDKGNNAIGDVNVKIWDVGGNLVVNVDTYPVGHANEGEIPVQILTNKEYPSQDIKTPHTIKISKKGYEVYNTPLAVNRPIDFEIGLKRITINIDNEVIS